MSEQNKGHLTMGLPRASGKRRWSGDGNADEVPTKVICTSPPHALCAEDVLHHPALTHAHASTPAIECELTTPVDSSDASEASTRLPEEEQDSSSSSSSSAPTAAAALQHTQDDVAFTESEDDSMDEHEDFIDDEEDKDSGFIDSNSIDNSSDDEVESRVISDLPVSTSLSSLSPSSSSLTTVTASSAATTTTTSIPHVSSSLQLSLSRVLPSSSSSSPTSSSTSTSTSSTSSTSFTTTTTTTTNSVTSSTSPALSSPLVLLPPTSPSPSPSPSLSPDSPDSPTTTAATTIFTPSTSPDSLVSNQTTCSTTTTTSVCSSGAGAGEERLAATLVSDGSVTTVTAAQTGTVVTSAYQGALTSPAYDPHSYPYPPESYPARPSTPAWGSCNFYDGSQPHTNKYMEISPSKAGGANQSIQCDENGKSYLELGSASPYTHTYSNECGNYTTSPSSYPSQTYNQTYTSSSTYGQPGAYYNTRQSYSPSPYVYPAGDGYAGFDGEAGCGYGYGASGYGGARGTLPPARGPQRCMSPYCDPTRGTAKPSCYHQQRLSVLNVSMYKLNRFRQFPEPNLHRSVLICNTLRHIERELEAEGVSVASLLAHSHSHGAHPHLQGAAPSAVAPCPEPMPSSPPVSPAPTEGPLPPMHSQLVGSPLAAPVSLPPSTPVTPPPPPPPPVSHFSTAGPTVQYPSAQYLPAEHQTTYDGRETAHLRPYQPLPASTHHSGSGEGPSAGPEESEEAEGPPPSPTIRSSPLPAEERTDAINWCSVLSLSSQTDLDSMNNNEYGDWGGESSADLDYGRADDAPPWKLPSLSADDVLKSFPEASKRLEANEDLDSIINVLVGS